MNNFLHWIPRALSLVFIAFLSLFALDVFTAPFEPLMLVGFLFHLLPPFVLLVLVFVAWRFPLVGAIAFIGFALAYVWLVGFDRPWSWYTAISLPSLIVGLLYLVDWWHHHKTVSINL